MKPNTPEQIWLGNKEYSWRTDWKVNGWLSAAAVISGVADIMFPHIVKQWPVAVQTMIAVLPFLAILFWIRSVTKWIASMDELHQRITVSAILFAVSGTFFLLMLWHRLDKAGLFQAISLTGGESARSWDIGTMAHAVLLLTLLYMVGHSRYNRRYQ